MKHAQIHNVHYSVCLLRPLQPEGKPAGPNPFFTSSSHTCHYRTLNKLAQGGHNFRYFISLQNASRVLLNKSFELRSNLHQWSWLLWLSWPHWCTWLCSSVISLRWICLHYYPYADAIVYFRQMCENGLSQWVVQLAAIYLFCLSGFPNYSQWTHIKLKFIWKYICINVSKYSRSYDYAPILHLF